jgi:hypothetical protein
LLNKLKKKQVRTDSLKNKSKTSIYRSTQRNRDAKWNKKELRKKLKRKKKPRRERKLRKKLRKKQNTIIWMTSMSKQIS